jgi:hypothetical protein
VIDWGYQWYALRYRWACVKRAFVEELPRRIAMALPRKVAYFAFIRVHAAGEIWWSFKDVADNWERKGQC